MDLRFALFGIVVWLISGFVNDYFQTGTCLEEGTATLLTGQVVYCKKP